MQFSRKSFSNLAALESGEESLAELQGGGPLASFDEEGKESNASLSEAKGKRLVFVSNHLPIKMSRNEVEDCYTFELDEDALLVQAAKEAVPEDMTPIYVGCLSQEIPVDEQDEVAAVLQKQHRCIGAQHGCTPKPAPLLGCSRSPWASGPEKGSSAKLRWESRSGHSTRGSSWAAAPLSRALSE